MGTTDDHPVLEVKAATSVGALAAGAEPVADDPLRFQIIGGVTGIVDEVGDIVEPGAYTDTLKKRRPKIIKDHDWSRRLGRSVDTKELMPGDPGLPSEISPGMPWPREAGALVSDVRLFDTREGRDAAERWREDDAQQFSIGYVARRALAGKTAGVKRRLQRLDLYEISDVLWGAMPAAGLMPSALATKMLAVDEVSAEAEDDEAIAEAVDADDAEDAAQAPEAPAKPDAPDAPTAPTPPTPPDAEDEDEAEIHADAAIDLDWDEVDEATEGKGRFAEASHPRDKNGRWIKSGDFVRVPGGDKAEVVGMDQSSKGGKLKVRTVDGAERSVNAASVEVVPEKVPNAYGQRATPKYSVRDSRMARQARSGRKSADEDEDVETKGGMPTALRDKLEKAGATMDDGSFPIANASDLSNAIQALGRAKNVAKARRHIIARARALDLVSKLPKGWVESKAWTEVDDTLADLAAGVQDVEFTEVKDAITDMVEGKGGVPGVADTPSDVASVTRLKQWYEKGGGAAKIRWGTDGDFNRCVQIASKHMTPERAKGFCNLRHQGAVGAPPGQGHKSAPFVRDDATGMVTIDLSGIPMSSGTSVSFASPTTGTNGTVQVKVVDPSAADPATVTLTADEVDTGTTLVWTEGKGWREALHPRDKDGKWITLHDRIDLPDGDTATVTGARPGPLGAHVTAVKPDGTKVKIAAKKVKVRGRKPGDSDPSVPIRNTPHGKEEMERARVIRAQRAKKKKRQTKGIFDQDTGTVTFDLSDLDIADGSAVSFSTPDADGMVEVKVSDPEPFPAEVTPDESLVRADRTPPPGMEPVDDNAPAGWEPVDEPRPVRAERKDLDVPWLAGSVEERGALLRNALSEALPGSHIEGTYDDHVIASTDDDGTLASWLVPYNVDPDAGTVDVGDPEEVRLVVVADDGTTTDVEALGDESPADLDAVTSGAATAVKALALAIEVKAGRVLSSSNESRLRAAVEHLLGVLKAAGIGVEADSVGVNAAATQPITDTTSRPTTEAKVTPAVLAATLARIHADIDGEPAE